MMRNTILLGMALLISAPSAFAGCIGPVVMGKCQGTMTPDYGSSRYGSSQGRYESTMGNRYQYDLSDPVDRIEYRTDYDAQLRDRLSVDPTRRLDRGLGQYGGGIYD